MDPHLFSILDLDPDPGGKNLREKTEKMRGTQQIGRTLIVSKFGLGPWFLLLSNLFCLFQLQKTLPGVIC